MKIGVIRRSCGIGLGGAEAYCENVSRALVNAGHQVSIIADLSFVKELPLFRARVFGRGSIVKNLSFFHSVDKFLKENRGRFDIVYGLSRVRNTDVLRISDPLHISWLRLGYSKHFLPFFLRRLLPRHLSILHQEKKAIETARYVLTNSKLVSNQLIYNYKISKKRLFTIYNGVDTKRFCPLSTRQRMEIKRELGISSDGLMMLFAGSDYKRKGLEELLEALRLIRRKDIFLVICGVKKNSFLGNLCKSLLIDSQVRFLGFRKDVERYYGACDLFCLPTYYDPFANVCLEAMACAAPVITTKTNGASEIVQKISGDFVIDRPDKKDIAKKLEKFLSLNRGQRNALRQKACEIAQKFDWSSHVDNLIELFESIKKRHHK